MLAVRSARESRTVGRMQDTLVAPGSCRGAPLPWWVEIAAKLTLSRLPVPHALRSKLDIFHHSYSLGRARQLVRARTPSIARRSSSRALRFE
jgi:hypothetical protein